MQIKGQILQDTWRNENDLSYINSIEKQPTGIDGSWIRTLLRCWAPGGSEGVQNLLRSGSKCGKKPGICLSLRSGCCFFTLDFCNLLVSPSSTNQARRDFSLCYLGLRAKPSSVHILAQNEQFYRGFAGKK